MAEQTYIIEFSSNGERFHWDVAEAGGSDEATLLAEARSEAQGGGGREAVSKRLGPLFSAFLELDALFGEERIEGGETWEELVVSNVVEANIGDMVAGPDGKEFAALELDAVEFDDGSDLPTTSATLRFALQTTRPLTSEEKAELIDALDQSIGTPQFGWYMGDEADTVYPSESDGGSGFRLI